MENQLVLFMDENTGTPLISTWNDMRQVVADTTQDKSAMLWELEHIVAELEMNDIHLMSKRDWESFIRDGGSSEDIEML